MRKHTLALVVSALTCAAAPWTPAGAETAPRNAIATAPQDAGAPTGANAAAPLPPPPTLDERLRSIDAYVERALSSAKAPGGALVVVKDGAVVSLRGFGLRHVDEKKPVTPDTLFPIASTSKSFTALALLSAVDRGALTLDDHPGKHIPGFRLKDDDAHARVTLRDMLSHRAGVRRLDIGWALFSPTRESILANIAFLDQQAAFRRSFVYNNYLYVAAGEAAARASGDSFEHLVQTRILDPLGMTNTVLSHAKFAASPDAAEPYSDGVEITAMNMDAAAPAGGVVTTARDMGAYVAMLANEGAYRGGRIVSRESFRTMTSGQIALSPDVHYGLGLFLHRWNGKRVIEHGGNVPGYTSYMAAMPDQRIGFALLTNAGYLNVGAAGVNERKLFDAIWKRLLDPTLPPDADKPAPKQPDAPAVATAKGPA